MEFNNGNSSCHFEDAEMLQHFYFKSEIFCNNLSIHAATLVL